MEIEVLIKLLDVSLSAALASNVAVVYFRWRCLYDIGKSRDKFVKGLKLHSNFNVILLYTAFKR